MAEQLSLFQAVTEAFAEAGELDNATLYRRVADRLGWAREQLEAREPVGRTGARHNTATRRVRWVQQTLKGMNLVERASRGVWRLTGEGRARLQLRQIRGGHVMLACSTDLGVALWADCRAGLPADGEPVVLALTSPPYPLRRPRAYGNVTETQWVDWLCTAIEPIVRRLAPGGSLVLNLGNDVFLPGSPARSLYRERLVLALAERFGLSLMDTMPWVNYAKPPGPTHWASIERVHLNTAWEPIYWFTNDPARVRADNRQVLEPHTERHRRLLAAGGERRDRAHADGAHCVRAGSSFSRLTEGRIPRNVRQMGHHCASQRAYKAAARAAGLPVHGAPFPLRLAEFYIRFLTVPGDLVVDPFAGSLTTALAAELLGRHWIATEVIWEYLAGGGLRLEGAPGFEWAEPFLQVA